MKTKREPKQPEPLSANEWQARMLAILHRLRIANDEVTACEREIQLMLQQWVVTVEVGP